MSQDKPIVNRVAKSPLITFKLENHYPKGERVLLDMKERLFQGMILREKDLREFVKEHDWAQYQDKHVAVHCSADAIVPMWAYMLYVVELEPYAATIVYGSLEDLEVDLFKRELAKIDLTQFQDRPVVIKGCSELDVPAAVYVEATRLIKPYAKNLMFGEPCSTVPLYKRPKKQ